MADTAHTSTAPKGRGIDLGLNVGVAILLVAVIGLTGWFGYTVWRDWQAEELTSAPGRLVSGLEDQVRKSPNDAILRVRLGEALGAAKRYPDAIEQLKQALKIDPKHIGAYLDLGMIAMLTDQHGQAENYFKKVIELTDTAQFSQVDERRENALYNLGLLKLDQKEYEDAAGYFKSALRIRKDASDTYLSLARALKGTGDVDGAIEQLEIAITFDPGFAEALYEMGRIYQEKGDDVNASYFFARAAEKAPDAVPPQDALAEYGQASDWLSRAQKSLAAGDLEKALTETLVARNLDPKSAEAARFHAGLAIKRGEFDSALEIYLEAREIDAKDASTNEGISAIEREHPGEALKVYREKLKATPNDKALKAKVAELEKASGAK